LSPIAMTTSFSSVKFHVMLMHVLGAIISCHVHVFF